MHSYRYIIYTLTFACPKTFTQHHLSVNDLHSHRIYMLCIRLLTLACTRIATNSPTDISDKTHKNPLLGIICWDWVATFVARCWCASEQNGWFSVCRFDACCALCSMKMHAKEFSCSANCLEPVHFWIKTPQLVSNLLRFGSNFCAWSWSRPSEQKVGLGFRVNLMILQSCHNKCTGVQKQDRRQTLA